MPDTGQFPNIQDKHTLDMPQEKVRAGVLPTTKGSNYSSIFAGINVDQYDPNTSTATLINKIGTYRKMLADPTISGALQGCCSSR